MSRKKKKIRLMHAIRRFTISAVMLIAIAILINLAPNYERNALEGKTNLIINNNNITKSLKSEILIEDGDIYLSIDDVKNFFDEYLIVENNKIITTSNTKTVAIPIDNGKIYENGSLTNKNFEVIKKDNKYYLPINKLSAVYNYEVKYNADKKIITVDSLNRRAVEAIASKNLNIKYKPTSLSKTVDKVKRGDTLTVIQNNEKGSDEKEKAFLKVRTQNGVIGYVKESNLINKKVVREAIGTKKIDGKVSMVWDYYNQYTAAPNRTDTIKGANVVCPSFFELKSDGSIAVNIGNSGKNYINWAKENNLEVWPVLSNSMLNNLDAVSNILSTFENRANLIDNIINELIKVEVNGIHVDFENMYKEDANNYSRFIIELAPRLREIGMRLSVLLTAPDGSDTWSLCYDRNTIGKVADYVVFMGYDQTPGSSKVAGTLSGYDWVELNIRKFLGQEGIDKNKVVLAMPFYTRLWKETNGTLTNRVVNMKDVVVPDNATKKWIENLKQNYIEYSLEDGSICKMWIEDEESIRAKIDLALKYDLAGVGFWEKDREKEDIWDIVEEKLK